MSESTPRSSEHTEHDRDRGPLLQGLPPVWRPDARILVLGSMPSTASLDKGEYYGNPKNAFWRVAGTLFGAGPELSYRERLAALQLRGIALWDVCGLCRRRGSADAAIREVTPNPIPDLVERSPELRLIACNGAKAHDFFLRLVVSAVPELFRGIAIERLPSTSPAHAARTEAEKAVAWRVVLEHAEPRA